MQVNMSWCEILRSHQINVVSRIHRILKLSHHLLPLLWTYENHLGFKPSSPKRSALWYGTEQNFAHSVYLVRMWTACRGRMDWTILSSSWKWSLVRRWCGRVEIVNLRISALLYSFIPFHDRVEMSMLMHNEKKVSGQACAYVGRWARKTESTVVNCSIFLHPSRFSVVWVWAISQTGWVPKTACADVFILQRGHFMEKGCQLRTLYQPHHHLI